ncbi:MAG TPA: protein kinase [Candidatus Peribacteraceae bacterium]|nr:protein kinase [Candidatus Peribacteraceae bacterium]
MIHSPSPGTDNIPSGTTSSSSSSVSADRGLSNDFHAERRSRALASQQEVRAYASEHFEDCKSWLESRGHSMEAAAFEDMDTELARRFGVQGRAMLYRLYRQNALYEKHGRELIVPEYIGEEARVLGTLGSGGAGDIFYCEPNIELLHRNVHTFVREIVELPSLSDHEEKIAGFTPILEDNIGRLSRMRDRRIATKQWRITGHEEDDILYERAAREMRRMIVDPANPLYTLIPHIVGGKLSKNERYFHMIYKPGVDLQTLIRASGNAVSWRILSDICAHLARILKLFDMAGMSHRDFTPRNILVTGEGLKVVDLGTTKRVKNETADLTQGIHGTLEFLAPEQAAGRTDLYSSQIDVYAMGHVMMAVADALAATHYPDGYQEDRHSIHTATHRAKQLEMWEDDHKNDAFFDPRAEWMKLRDLHLSPDLEREAAADPRVARYLESWKDKVWMMTHPIPAMRPSPSEVFASFVRHSRFARAPNEFLAQGGVPRQWKKEMIIEDPVDPHVFLAMLHEEATAPQNLRRPGGHDVLEDFHDEPPIRRHRSHIRRRMMGMLLASGAVAATSAGLYLWQKPSVPPKEQQARQASPQPEHVDRPLTEPLMIVRAVPDPQHPVDKVLDFPGGKILLQQGHPRGFELRIDEKNTISRTSTAYCIRNESSDPAREESLMGFVLDTQIQERLESVFPEMKGIPPDTSDLNMFLFTRGGERLLLLPRGGGLSISTQNGQTKSIRFMSKTAPPDIRKRCAELSHRDFNGYVAPKSLPATVFMETLRKHQDLSRRMLEQYAESSQ